MLSVRTRAIADALDAVAQIVVSGGPTPDQYGALGRAIDAIHCVEFVQDGGWNRRIARDEGFLQLVARHPSVFSTTLSMQGFVRLKPHGYAGDWEVIERTYAKASSGLPHLLRWDEFFHTSAEAAAVRNRAGIFHDLVLERSPRSVASIACGPGLDIAAALDSFEPDVVMLLDNDANAMRRARVNLRAFKGELAVEQRNALRWRSGRKFDLVWCAGLLDYLENRTAVLLIRRLLESVGTSGTLAIGNFAPGHASRPYMEVVGDWILHHRTEDDLLRLAQAADIPLSKATVRADSTGVNLFLTVRL